MREEVHGTDAVSRRKTEDAAHAWLFPYAAGPDIAVGIFVLFRFHRFRKPLVLYGGVPGDKVEQNLHAAAVHLAEEPCKVIVCAVSRRDGIIVGNIIACVTERRLKERIQPYRVATELLYIIELFYDSVYISHAVCI